MGYQSHYDYLKSISLNKFVQIHLILFFTDDQNLCILRAAIRHKNGGHLVSSNVIIEMYKNTLPLLKQHLALFTSITFVSVNKYGVEHVKKDKAPPWMGNSDFIKYLKE